MNEQRKQLIQSYYENKIPNFSILVDHIKNPHDIAAIARSADGLGIETMYLYYTNQEFPNMDKIGKKSSASANKWIHFVEVHNLTELTTIKKQEGYSFIGISPNTPDNKSLSQYTFPPKTILVVGENELAPELQTICTDHIFPPKDNPIAQYTLSTYTSIAIYEIFLQYGKHLSSNNLIRSRGRQS